MSSNCIPTASVVAADNTTTSVTPTTLSLHPRHFPSHFLSFSLSSKPFLRLFSKGAQQSTWTALTRNVSTMAQLNNAGVGGPSSGPASKSEESAQEIKNGKPTSESVPKPLASEESISEFISQVASLVKLVDSRDIVELKMKQLDCEVLIRKKEAITQAPPAHMVMMQSHAPPTAAAQPISTSSPAPSIAMVPAPSVPKPAKSSIPPLKSPMAGTFYRSPSPGAPPFVKVGDQVQKGQVLCIIEAMKLMNEIEADQSGTVVEIIAEDGKPVSLDSDLFAIQP